MKVDKRRDLSILEIGNGNSLVIACDSCGGIGLKKYDVLKCEPFYVGAFTSRVALMEVLASGASIVSVVNNICCEMNDTGKEIIRGIKHELSMINADQTFLTGSTEENFKTDMTALGVTVVGIAKSSELRFHKAQSGDYITLIGSPKVGHEINLTYDSDLATYNDIKSLLTEKYVLEIVPVGSKGIFYECSEIAKYNKMELKIINTEIDLYKSAGPATCVLALISKDNPTLDRYNLIAKLI